MRWLAFALVCASSATGYGQQYKGASAALKEIDVPAAKSMGGPSKRSQLKDFGRSLRSMPPKEAAGKWFEFAKGAGINQGASFGQVRPEDVVTFGEVMVQLPGPASWPEIERLAKANVSANPKKPAGYPPLLISELLQGDTAAEWKTLESFRSLPPSENGSSLDLNSIAIDIAAFNHDPIQLEKALRLSASQKGAYIDLPDMIGLFGKAKASQLIGELMLEHPLSLRNSVPEATLVLARSIALQNIGKLKVPQWDICQSTEAVALYEAMVAKFPKTPPGVEGNAYEPKKQARSYYILGLIVHGQSEKAADKVVKTKGDALATEAMYNITSMLEKKGYSDAVYQFLDRILAKHPELPLWSALISVSAETGNSERTVALLKQALAQPSHSEKNLYILQNSLSNALLSSGDVEAGVRILTKVALQKQPTQSSYDPNYTDQDLGLKLAKIGHLLHREDWLATGLKAAHALIQQRLEAEKTGDYRGGQEDLPEFLFQIGRGPEAEQMLIDELKRSVNGLAMGGNTGALVELTSIYERSGRFDDVVTLLTDSPDWGCSDLAKIYTQSDLAGRPFGYVAASALAQTGHKTEAVLIAEAVIRSRPAYDPAYKLLLDLNGEAALPLFQSIYFLDQFEPRPLIWTAESLRRSGKLDEAEKYARKAIQVDPSDGAQHLGTRLMAYSVLADVRGAQGVKEDAEQFRSAVKAIRHAEEADKFQEVGLEGTAIKMYREALDTFQNAYCIQSRLAVDLADQGKYDEATVHYRKAYELMPDSFGRVETHCLGCERVFDGKVAQSLAENVFSRLLANAPKKPQLHYLLGYLREDEYRYSEAAANYREAVDLDPDYLNAWVHLGSMGEHGALTPKESQKVALEILRLDPQGNHAQNEIADIHDFKSMWLTLDASLQHLVDPPETLFTLTESDRKIAAQKGPTSMGGTEVYSSPYEYMYGSRKSASQGLLRVTVLRDFFNM